MRKSLFAWALLCAVAFLFLSCAHDQVLVSIQVQPTSLTFGSSTIPVIDNEGTQVQLQALGSYIHPPVTKNITSQVTWSSNTPQMMTVNSSGLLTVTGLSCGTASITATATTNTSPGGISSSGAIVQGSTTGNVVCYEGSESSNPVLIVSFGPGSGSGTVTSSPSGLTCASPGPCLPSQAFMLGTSIALTATPNSGSTASWPSCPVPTATAVCTFTLSTNPTLATAEFNN